MARGLGRPSLAAVPPHFLVFGGFEGETRSGQGYRFRMPEQWQPCGPPKNKRPHCHPQCQIQVKATLPRTCASMGKVPFLPVRRGLAFFVSWLLVIV